MPRKKKDIKDTDVNKIKLGNFQLQTKSFWISLVSILCIFLLLTIYINTRFYFRITEEILTHETEILKLITDSKDSSAK